MALAISRAGVDEIQRTTLGTDLVDGGLFQSDLASSARRSGFKVHLKTCRGVFGDDAAPSEARMEITTRPKTGG
jgi:hypothetical protein